MKLYSKLSWPNLKELGAPLGSLIANGTISVKEIVDPATVLDGPIDAFTKGTTLRSLVAYGVVSVSEHEPVAVTGVSLNKSALTLNVGANETLVATIAPENATDKAIAWSTSDGTKATVSDQGVVTAVAEGTATITATTHDGSFTASCVVTVESPAP